jgi:two-component system LytT family sensor kinase
MASRLEKGLDTVLQYKMIHIIFWILKALALYHQLSLNNHNKPSWNIFYTVNDTLFEMLAVYISIYYLFPRFYVRKKFPAFWFSVLFLVLLLPVFNNAVQAVALNLFGRWHPNTTTLFIFLIGHFIDMSIVTFAFIIIILVQFYYKRDKQNQQLEKSRLEAELSYLKAQINPHFLFNALNSIYVLMHEDIKKSEETLLKFSALLRYQLYDCSHKTTTLENELEFLRNYVSLEQLRGGKNRRLQLSLPDDAGFLRIAPFIISPFVENAFKHISNYKDKLNEIRIDLKTDHNSLLLEVENTFEELQHETETTRHGIGLQNVKRRLELEYPNKHQLSIEKKAPLFKVSLKLELDQSLVLN